MTAMQNFDASRMPVARGAFIGVLAGLLVTVAAMGPARAQEDDAFDVRFLRQIMRGVGLQSSSDPQIHYQERPPLVVPPGRDLPPPQSELQASNNPAWPNDPDVRQRRLDAARAKRGHKSAAETEAENSRVLRPNELAAGRTGRRDDFSKPAPSAEQSASPMGPRELGSGNIFRNLWSRVAPAKDEVATFSQEPTRSNLIEPPPGYQTPSPNQPYGLTKRSARPKASDTFIERPEVR